MKQFLLVLFLTACVQSFGQTGKLKAFIDQKTWYSPESGTYAELHVQFVGYTLKYLPVNGGLQARVAISAVVLNAAQDTVRTDAYVLESPVMRDSVIEDFFDVIRFPLKPGEYQVAVSLQDMVSNVTPMTGKIDLTVSDMGHSVGISDIMVAEVAVRTTEPTVFSKSGYDIIPRISNFYAADLSSLPYYTELYNTPMLKDSVFAMRQRIISTTDSREMTDYTRFTKMKSAEVVPVFRNLDISRLPSGSYRLELTIFDRSNTPQGTPVQYYFERVNELEESTDIADVVLDPAFQASISDDSVAYYLASLVPIARPAEIKNILATIKSGSKENARRHIQQFWLQTSGNNAYEAWMTYKRQVMLVEKLYGNNFKNGYESDRGRVYLQYGPPSNIVSRETSPDEYPYEIWHYYKIKMYSNKRFVFYNPDLVNKNYQLLHSDMVGEQQNYRWPQALAKRTSPNHNIDDANDGNNPHFGGNSQADFNLTR